METSCHDLRYPVGIQTFSGIREGGYVYVDKTAYVHKLAKQGKYFFLSRPRRFGKSLLLSTIEAYYSGRRHLFKGLALDSLTDDWEPHPVLHLDLNTGLYDSAESLEAKLDYELSRWERMHGVTRISYVASLRFGHIIEHLHLATGKKVVVLIDEYDKPMLNAIDNEALADQLRDILKSFYGNLKTMDQHIELAMLTGVARFSKVSIFSDLNNLRDISFEPSFSGICGITNEEIDRYFAQGVKCLADRMGITTADARAELKRRYDGYHFAADMLDVYNPFSLVNVFASEMLSDYWFSSGTPSYVVKLLKSRQWRLRDIERYTIDADKLGNEGIMSREAIPTLYQSGYLNDEVERCFINFLRPIFLGEDSTDSEFNTRRFVMDVRHGEAE